MKKTLLSIFILSIIAIGTQLILTSSSNGRAFAANSGNTGAPGESTTCRSCHGTGLGTTVSIVLKDTLGNAVTSYIPGAIYRAEFTVNAVGASRYGFQMVSLNASNSPVNGFSTPSANTRLVTLGIGRQYAEHAGKSVSNSFSTQWTAPASGTGPITFYGAGAAVNNNGNTGGDGGNIATLVMFENTSVGIVEPTLRNQVLVYPNPTSNVIKIKNTKTDMNEAIAQLYSVSGQLVLSENISLKKDNPQILNVSNLDNGYYILIIRNGDESLEEKILIQN